MRQKPRDPVVYSLQVLLRISSADNNLVVREDSARRARNLVGKGLCPAPLFLAYDVGRHVGMNLDIDFVVLRNSGSV